MNKLKSGVTVSIVTYNTWPRTIECINSVADSFSNDSFEILVYDNGSEQPGQSEWQANVRVTRSARNVGFGAGHNANLDRASFDTFLILNPDVTLSKEPLEALIEAVHEPGIAAAAPILVYPNGEAQLSLRNFPTLLTEVGRIFFLDRRLGSRWSTLVQVPQGNGQIPVDQPAAAVLAVRTSLIQGLGGFDTTYPMYFEDVDLCRRLHAVGDVVVLPEFRAIHDGEGTAKHFRKATTFWIENSRRRYHKKFEQGMRRNLILGAVWASGLTHAVATAARASLCSGPRRQELLAKSQGYFASTAATFFGTDKYWRSKFLSK